MTCVTFTGLRHTGDLCDIDWTSHIILISTIVIVSQIKFTLKCLLNSLLYFIGMLVIIYLLNYYLF